MLAAQAMGADFAYIGSAFIATDEARARRIQAGDRRGDADDIVGSDLFTGVYGNYLRPRSSRRARPRQSAERRRKTMNFESAGGSSQGLARHLGLRARVRRDQSVGPAAASSTD